MKNGFECQARDRPKQNNWISYRATDTGLPCVYTKGIDLYSKPLMTRIPRAKNEPIRVREGSRGTKSFIPPQGFLTESEPSRTRSFQIINARRVPLSRFALVIVLDQSRDRRTAETPCIIVPSPQKREDYRGQRKRMGSQKHGLSKSMRIYASQLQILS